MKLKRLFARLFGVSAVRMTIRRHVPWPLRLLPLALAIAVSAVCAVWLWQMLFGNVSATQNAQSAEIARLKSELEGVNAERLRLEAIVNSADSQIKVEQTAASRLVGQIKSLEQDNARLKSDVAYFESLLPAAGQSDAGVSIRRFEVMQEAQGSQLRYRALVLQGGRQEKEFSGSVQLVVATMNAGKPVNWTWPDQAGPEMRDRGRLSFKRYQRLEGVIDLPAGSTVRSVQLRVLEKGVVRAQQAASL